MIYGESFRARDTFSTDQTGRPEAVLRLKPNNFDGPIANWAKDRARRFGETIIPKEVYLEQPPYKKPHRVAWVFHEGLSAVTGEPFAVHHVACDCSGEVEKAETHEGRQVIMDACPAILPVIEQQAELVNLSYQISTIMEGLNYDPSRPLKRQDIIIKNFVDDSILSLMERDYVHPESWIANIESGWSVPALMALVMKITPEDVAASVDRLVERGDLEVNDINFGLAQHRKDVLDKTDLDSRFNQIVGQLR